MLNPIQAFGYMNSAIQSNTGYSFSQLAKNINKIALPAIALVGMYMSLVSAEDCSRICPADPDYDDCIAFCVKETLPYESFLHELGTCVRVCVAYYP